MTDQLNETHDARHKSWLAAANDPRGDFPLQNLPYGVFKKSGNERPRVGVAIGDHLLDVSACQEAGLLAGEVVARAALACAAPTLNELMALDWTHWSQLRRALFDMLRADETSDAASKRERIAKFLVPLSTIEMQLPAHIGDYTDFYSSIYHATNVGEMFRPDKPLLPNYKYVPIGYHGRASSIVASGALIKRPHGQIKDEGAETPTFGPSQRIDYEMEVGFFVGTGNELGRPIAMDEAERHVFGFCLVNDWSARDIQTWEYQPLGPFLAKNFATTISPWIVTLEALAPYRTNAFVRAAADPPPLPYLSSSRDCERGAIDLTLDVHLSSRQMRTEKREAVRLSRSNFRDLYWTFQQQLVHHTSNGCNLRPGDLLASGTVSGAGKDARGCLLELTWRGTQPLTLPTGETRRFLADGDEVVMCGHCEKPNFARLGFGECRGEVTGA